VKTKLLYSKPYHISDGRRELLQSYHRQGFRLPSHSRQVKHTVSEECESDLSLISIYPTRTEILINAAYVYFLVGTDLSPPLELVLRPVPFLFVAASKGFAFIIWNSYRG
jgi:hypothetical protein